MCMLNFIQVTYNSKLVIDINGDIVSSTCECAVGAGSHATCKHIAAMAVVLVNFTADGSYAVPGSCTDNLQLFHKPAKVHSGRFK